MEAPGLPAGSSRQARLPGPPVHNAVLAIAADLAFLALHRSLLRLRPLPCGRQLIPETAAKVSRPTEPNKLGNSPGSPLVSPAPGEISAYLSGTYRRSRRQGG